MTPRITCSMVERWICLSLDGELFPEHEEQLESHLDSCARCRGHFEEAARDQALLEREMDQLSGTVGENKLETAGHIAAGTLDVLWYF